MQSHEAIDLAAFGLTYNYKPACPRLDSDPLQEWWTCVHEAGHVPPWSFHEVLVRVDDNCSPSAHLAEVGSAHTVLRTRIIRALKEVEPGVCVFCGKQPEEVETRHRPSLLEPWMVREAECIARAGTRNTGRLRFSGAAESPSIAYRSRSECRFPE